MRIIPQNIMCAVDFSDFTPFTLSYGMAMAKEFKARLTVCHVVPGQVMHLGDPQYHVNVDAIEKEQIAYAQTQLEELIRPYDYSMDTVVESGHSAEQIAAAALDTGSDMVIAATHGRSGIKRFLIGSVTERLIKILHCPLMVLHSDEGDFLSAPGHRIDLKKILVGCDFSKDSQMAFDYGLSLAQEFESELHLAHVIKPSESIDEELSDMMMFQSGDLMRWHKSNYLERLEKNGIDLQEQKGILFSRLERQLKNLVPEESEHWCTPVTVLLEGEPYRTLVQYANHNEIDLIVLGIRGHGLIEQFLVGATTDRVIRRAKCSVLAVRQQA